MKKYLITQLYFTSNKQRNQELLEVVSKHALNEFDKIFYLNEKHYDINYCDKVEEVIIKNRLYFDDVFNFVQSRNLDGIIYFCNSDIFFDNSIHNIPNDIKQNPVMYCQLRYEYINEDNIYMDPILYNHGYSQDCWIYHSNFNSKLIDSFHANFGIPGCDSIFTSICQDLGFELRNYPNLCKCFHLHNVQYRTNDRDFQNSNKQSTKIRIKAYKRKGKVYNYLIVLPNVDDHT